MAITAWSRTSAAEGVTLLLRVSKKTMNGPIDLACAAVAPTERKKAVRSFDPRTPTEYKRAGYSGN